MNVVFISPNFPPQFRFFCTALKERGVNVLAIGDVPGDQLSPDLRWALADYVFLPRMESYDEMVRALGYLTWKHGKIDRIDSQNEYWLDLEAKLREDFNVFGQRPAQVHMQRLKSGMADIFREAKIPAPELERVAMPEQVRSFAKRVGFPLVFKPDCGVGADGAFKVSNESELEVALNKGLVHYVVQQFCTGKLVTFDGLTDAKGKILFNTSFAYNSGVMEVLKDGTDMWYYSRREIPAALGEIGSKIVQAFNIRERFFHLELFEMPDGTYKALEVNLRPPGGFTTDLTNFAYDIDVYRLWAAVLTGDPLEGFSYQRKYHCAHVSRREGKPYRRSHEEIVRELGPALMDYRRLYPPVSTVMGEHVYIVRHPEEKAMLDYFKLIQETV